MIHFVTLGFCPARILRASMTDFKSTTTFLPTESKHWLLDQHYPLNRERNKWDLEKLCEEYGITMIDSGRDRGLHNGFNYLCSQIDLKEEDIIIMFDPDSCPLDNGWDFAMVHALQSDPKLGMVYLNNHAAFGTKDRDWKFRYAGQVQVAVPSGPTQININAWKWSFLKACGGFSEPTNYYGHLESAMSVKLKDAGLDSAMILGFTEDFKHCGLHDAEYYAYKQAHAHSRKFGGSFAEYLVSIGR